MTINLGLLSSAMGLSEGTNPVAVWRERFRWLTPYYIASGPLAFVMAYAYDRLGILGLAAFALPPAFMMVSVRQYIPHTTQVGRGDPRVTTTICRSSSTSPAGSPPAPTTARELRSYAEDAAVARCSAPRRTSSRSRQPAASRSSPAARRSDGWPAPSASTG